MPTSRYGCYSSNVGGPYPVLQVHPPLEAAEGELEAMGRRRTEDEQEAVAVMLAVVQADDEAAPVMGRHHTGTRTIRQRATCG